MPAPDEATNQEERPEEQERVITAIQGPVVRLATVCESIIEEVGTHTTTIVRMIDAVDYSIDEIAMGDTTLPGFVAFMGYDFPGEEVGEVEASILVATDQGDVIGVSPRRFSIQEPARAFAVAVRLTRIRIARPGRYVLALAYQDQEIARAYLNVRFASPESVPNESDGT
jgi:hypothetical protein